MPAPTIELQDVSIGFHGEPLLNNVNLQIQDGETFVLIGPSGEGKTVTLKLVAGLLEPDSGRVLIEGNDLAKTHGKKRDELMYKIGMLFQKNALFDSFTCGENIAFPMRETTKASEEEIQQSIDYFLEAVDIPHARDLFPDEISGGMQKRLGIARALALKPKIVFYDDPTAGLDPITSRKIIELIIQLRKENGSTVIAITNDMNRAFQMADRIGMVVQGELIVTGTVSETKSHPDGRVQQFIAGKLEGPLSVQEGHDS